jgi:hypothetical protein
LTWSTWVVITVLDTAREPVHISNTGQLIAYDPPKNFACRYSQEDLLKPSTNRSVDMCDYNQGKHYAIKSHPFGQDCVLNEPISGTLNNFVWPQAFLDTAVFRGTDRLADIICNHFHSDNIVVDGKVVLFDVWTSVETGYPCQIYAWEKSTTIHRNWAFVGFTETIAPSSIQCTGPQLICTQPNWVCAPKPGIPNDNLGMELRWVCEPTRLDCSPINPHGPFYLPNTVQNHCSWAFNAYYLANRAALGLGACNFSNTAQLIPPPLDIQTRSLLQSPPSIINNLNLVC